MISLRPYQTGAVDGLALGFAKYLRQIYQAPTGSGKTVVFSEIVRRASVKNKRVVICTNRIELFTQTLKALSITGKHIQLINAENKTISPYADINLAMVETLKRRIKAGFKIDPDIIIIDECHIASFNSIIDHFPNTRILGCSASPLGKHIFKYYQNIICAPQISELIAQGYLCDYKAYEMRDDISDLEKDSTGEYTESSLFKHYNKTERYAGVIQEYINRINGLKTIVFCVNVEHTINTCASFRAAGISAEYVTGETPKQKRKEIFLAFSRGNIMVLVNCGIAVFGYDEPSIQAVILDFATTSLPKFLQTIGRGSRIYRNKEVFFCLDFGKNHSTHGMWSQDRTWSLTPPSKRKAKIGAAPIKKCKQCEAVIAAQAKSCKYCGYVFEEGKKELKEGVMVEVKPPVPSAFVGRKVADLGLTELAELQKSKAYKASYVWRVIRNKGEDAIKEFASLMGYKNGWIDRQIKDQENSNFKNYILK